MVRLDPAGSLNRILLSWSSGKDSAWALHQLRSQQVGEVAGLLTTYNAAVGRVAMHAVRRELVESQGKAAALPVQWVPLPSPCDNETYGRLMSGVIGSARASGITHIAFGDLFLEQVRDYRMQMMAGTGIEPLFPLWSRPEDTPGMARRMIDAGVKAVLTCVDPRQLDPAFVGREFDRRLLADLPGGVDPCGERGEYHSFCYAGPMFDRAIGVRTGERVSHDGFQFIDVKPLAPGA